MTTIRITRIAHWATCRQRCSGRNDRKLKHTDGTGIQGQDQRVIWSQAALLDVQRLYRFLAPKNLDAAKRAVKALRTGLNVLQFQSEIGRPINDMPTEFREWIIDFGDSGYVVRYRIDSELVIILAVRHQKEVGY